MTRPDQQRPASTFMLLITHSAETATAAATSGPQGVAQQREQLEALGLRVLGQWLVLGRQDVAILVEGAVDAVLAFSVVAQHARQSVEVLPLVEADVTGEVQSRLQRLVEPEVDANA